MISCIICSRQPDIAPELRANIDTTCGAEHEIVVIDNSQNTHSIFTAYNEGVRRAQGDILCFMHDDILFHTQDWGQRMAHHFTDETIGLIGFAGAHFMPAYPTYWWSSPFKSQYNLDHEDGVTEQFFFEFFRDELLADVVACDGQCLFIPKSLFGDGKLQYDEKTYGNGFHFYDMDICMQVQTAGKRVCVCRDVLVEHNWNGHVAGGNAVFYAARDKFFNKWKHAFPMHRGLPDMPEYVFTRINYLYRDAYSAECARNSKAYRLGNAILKPFKKIRGLFS